MDDCDISNFVIKSNTNPSCNVSVLRRSSDMITEAANPDGGSGLIHRKLPHIRAVVIDVEIEQSMFSVSSRLLSRMFALRRLDDLKNAFA